MSNAPDKDAYNDPSRHQTGQPLKAPKRTRHRETRGDDKGESSKSARKLTKLPTRDEPPGIECLTETSGGMRQDDDRARERKRSQILAASLAFADDLDILFSNGGSQTYKRSRSRSRCRSRRSRSRAPRAKRSRSAQASASLADSSRSMRIDGDSGANEGHGQDVELPRSNLFHASTQRHKDGKQRLEGAAHKLQQPRTIKASKSAEASRASISNTPQKNLKCEGGNGGSSKQSEATIPSPVDAAQSQPALIKQAAHALDPPNGRSLGATNRKIRKPAEDIYVPPVPPRNSRRNSNSTEAGTSAYNSSLYSPTDEFFSRPATSQALRTSILSLGTYSDDGRLDTTQQSSLAGNSPTSRSSVPPVSLRNRPRGLVPDGRSHSRPRVGAMSSVDESDRSGSIALPRRGLMESLRSIRNDVMVNFLYQQASQKSLLVVGELWQGVVLKRARGDYACCPPQLIEIQNGLYAAVREMNVRCAMTVDTHVTQTILESMEFAGFDYVPLPGGLRVQVVPAMEQLTACQLHHFAAFIADLEILVVWDDDPDNLLARAEQLQTQFVQLLWAQDGEDDDDDGGGPYVPGPALSALGHKDEGVDFWNVEAATEEQPRRVKLNCAFIMSCTLCIAIICLATGWRQLVIEVKTDGQWRRLALLATIPAQFFASMFFFHALVGNVCQMLGPVSQINNNSKCFSGKAPAKRLQRDQDSLPHLTIQMPVYKEGLQNVIRPTVLSIKAAISTYEMQGGTASIFINDDGMQLISPETAQARRDFYDEHKIGWVARPGHGSVVGRQKPFSRRGKFKKASNMNFCLNVSNRVEDRLQKVKRFPGWTQRHEDKAYEEALAAVLAEDRGRTWADGNIRIGKHILIIDSDTRIPRDCILDAVSEMEQSPQVAILQFAAGVLNVTESFFEKGMTWFTEMIYVSITYSVAGGDATPFVGHNAILRWEALQAAAAYHDPEDGYEKYWSEDHVSEDFAMALCMLSAGYQLRYASYKADEFMEGVSLTVYDELARWEKYAYGVNEVVFHPFRKWITRGPFTPLFRSFVMAKEIPIVHKLTIGAYLGTYYAIASAFPLSTMNYFLTGWEYGIFDKFYRDSFSIFFAIIVVFTALGNIALATLRYRLQKGGLKANLMKNLRWVPFFTIFLGGLSLHLSQSILSHFFEIDMTWEATAKEAQDVVFGNEVLRILKKFKGTFLICLLCIGAVVYLAIFAPYNWQITHFASIFPLGVLVLSHLLLPLALSPALMRLNW